MENNTNVFSFIAGVFGKKRDDSSFDEMKAWLKKTKPQCESKSEAEAKDKDGKLMEDIRAAGTNGPALSPTPARDKNSRKEEISKLGGLSIPQEYTGPGSKATGLSDANNFKHWLSGGGGDL